MNTVVSSISITYCMLYIGFRQRFIIKALTAEKNKKVRFLGPILDHKISWKMHINHANLKISDLISV